MLWFIVNNCIQEIQEEIETDDLVGDLEHEKEKEEPIIPETDESPEKEIVDETMDDEEIQETEDENDKQYANMFLDDLVRALKYNPQLVQNLLDGEIHNYWITISTLQYYLLSVLTFYKRALLRIWVLQLKTSSF